MPVAGLVDVDGEVGSLSGPHGANLQLHLVVLVHVGLHDNTEILLWVFLPDPETDKDVLIRVGVIGPHKPRQQGEVDVHPASSVRPQLHLVGLDLGHRGLPGLLVHRDVVHPDQGLRVRGGGGGRQVDAELGLDRDLSEGRRETNNPSYLLQVPSGVSDLAGQLEIQHGVARVERG